LKGRVLADMRAFRQWPLLAIALASFMVSPLALAQSTMAERQEALKLAAQASLAAPRDTKKRFDLAEAMRLCGEPKKAAIEYLDVTSLDPSYYIAYHNLLKCKPTVEQLDEGLDRLGKLEAQQPKNLMLRVAISEVYEQKGDLYQAARSLVDLQYSHSIPEKYLPKINQRIHFLLMKAKDVQTIQTAEKTQQAPDDEIDGAPLPLPEAALDKDLSATKLKDSKVTEGYGHARLLP
jgi:hypothetical protein